MINKEKNLAIKKPSSAEKSSVAWFKLAEYVSRGERERALGLYRLLSHSLGNDMAFIKKLEADLWTAFDEKEAEAHYVQAAHLYKIAGKLSESLLIFELLADRYLRNCQYLEKIIELTQALQIPIKSTLYAKKLCGVLITDGNFEKAIQLFNGYELLLKSSDKLQFYQHFVINALLKKYGEQEVIAGYLHKTLDGLLRSGGQQEVDQFLQQIQAINVVWYKDAVAYLAQ